MYNEQGIERVRQAQKEWEEATLEEELKERGEWKDEFKTDSGIIVKRIYTPLDVKPRWDYVEEIGFPGQYPFVRGRTATMYRGEPGFIFQYAGFGTAEATNEWFKYLLQQGGKELAIALDLPTQIGLDSDHPLARGEVGRAGVAVDSLADMEVIFDGIDLEKVYVGGVFACIGPFQTALMLALAEKRDIPVEKLHLSLNNDSLKEYTVRGTYIFPSKVGLKVSCDLIEWVIKNKLLDNIHPLQYSGYHFREAGGTVYHELGFALANARAYIEELMRRGIDINDFCPDVLFTAGFDLFEEVCKFRAFRRMLAKMMKEKYHVTNPRAMSFFYRAGCNSARLTAQQPLNNIIRGTISALVQQLGGVRYMNVASYDEALSIPTPESVRISYRTHQIVTEESGVINTVDPLAGSYYVESLTDEIEERATELTDRVEKMGGAVAAIEQGYIAREISQAAHQYMSEIESGERVLVGVNKYQVDEPVRMKIMKVDPKEEDRQIEKLNRLRKDRDNAQVQVTLKELKQAAQEGVNLVLPITTAVKAYATIGEIFGTLKEVFGEYRETTL